MMKTGIMEKGNESSLPNSRPFLRGAMARALYDKMLSEQYVKNYDKSQWYECDLQKVETHLCEKFVHLSLDEETEEFLKKSEEKSDWLFTQIWHVMAKVALCLFMTQTSINGLLNRGSMFVFSSDQFVRLLGVDKTWKAGSLLDLGAGDGEVTAKMASFFKNVYATEVSSVMKNILGKKGYNALGIDDWKGPGSLPHYDVICCLNLLDRCDHPLTLLEDIKKKLTSDGILIVGLVLPVRQFVEYKADHKPAEELPVVGESFEDQVNDVGKLFDSLGLSVVRWSRLPYLCEGDMQQPYYWLHDSLFVLKKSSST